MALTLNLLLRGNLRCLVRVKRRAVHQLLLELIDLPQPLAEHFEFLLDLARFPRTLSGWRPRLCRWRGLSVERRCRLVRALILCLLASLTLVAPLVLSCSFGERLGLEDGGIGLCAWDTCRLV
eukprot:scaffold216001_cov31-Tisochrysis_lutea.AAC.1